MPTRSSTSEYQPSPPINRVPAPGGKVVGRLGIRRGTTVHPGVKPNCCVAPATNGERAFGKVAASQPTWTTKQMKVTPAL
jgi:hypothetical protein